MTSRPRYDAPSLGGPISKPEVWLRIAAPTTGSAELDAIAKVLASGILTNGPVTEAFEAAMAGHHETEHAVAFANGSVALAAMYLAHGIGPGDEVIVPSLTFISTATSVLHVGATPVFADVLPDTLNLDPDDVARRITPRTKAIVPVHYAGQAADLDRFRDLADEAGVALLEDAAEAHGATFGGRPVGGWGDAAMFSFTPTKNITTGEGSIVTTNDGDLARTMRLLRNHGMDAPYHHAILGWNWRLSDIQSAMGVCQLDRLEGILEAKRQTAAALSARLTPIRGVRPPVEAPNRDHTYMIYTATFDRGRDDVVQALATAGIETRVYFPPVHRQPVFQSEDHLDLPVTDDLADRILSLPVHHRVTNDDLDLMAAIITDALDLSTT